MIKIKPSFHQFKRPSDHSTFSPSATDRWIACPYSIQAGKDIPNETSVYAEAGTLAHQVCEDYANHYFFDAPVTQVLKDALAIDQQNAEGWVDVIKGWLNNESLGDVIFFELEVGLPIYPELGCFGTADALVIGTKGCAVIDYKNGVGHSVGAATPQLRTYLLSILEYVEDLPEDYQFNAVVYQPNLDEIPREITYAKSDLENHRTDVLHAINEAASLDAQPCTGSHCYWCPAKRTKDKLKKCPAIVQKDIETANTRFDEFFSDMQPSGLASPQELDRRDKALVRLMSLMPLLNTVVKDAEAEFLERIKNGESIDGVELKESLGNRKWAMPDKELATKLESIYGIDPRVVPPPRIKTVTEVEKEVGKKNFDAELVTRPVSHKITISEDRSAEFIEDLSNSVKNIV